MILDGSYVYQPYGVSVARQGWQCPACKRIWNPDVQYCDCQKAAIAFTSDSTSSAKIDLTNLTQEKSSNAKRTK